MLPEGEIRERAVYCCSVFLQLSWLYSNEFVEPSNYLTYLKKSSLGIGEDEFIVTTLQESLLTDHCDGALQSLITLYEGFAGAFCEVLETTMDDLMSELSPDKQKKLAMEVGVDIKL